MLSRFNSKLLFWAFIVLILCVANLLLFVWPETSSGPQLSDRAFMLDTAQIESISIRNADYSVKLSREGNSWKLNEDLNVDPAFKSILLGVLERTRLRKEVKDESKEWSDLLNDTGQEVQVVYKGGELNFSIGGNPTFTKTLVAYQSTGKIHEVYIPGYTDYLGGIFTLHPDQWRERVVYNGSWRTIQSIEIDHLNAPGSNIRIFFEDEFFKIENLVALDSNRVIDYLNQFQFLQVNEWISKGRFSRYDSLVGTDPIATMTIDDINWSDNLVFRVYPSIANENYQLVSSRSGEMMLFDKNRIQTFLRGPEYFTYRD